MLKNKHQYKLGSKETGPLKRKHKPGHSGCEYAFQVLRDASGSEGAVDGLPVKVGDSSS